MRKFTKLNARSTDKKAVTPLQQCVAVALRCEATAILPFVFANKMFP